MLESLRQTPAVSVRKSVDADGFNATLATLFPDYILDMGPRWKQFRAETSLASLSKIHVVRSAAHSAFSLKVRNSAFFILDFPTYGACKTVSNGIPGAASSEGASSLEPGEFFVSTASEYRDNVLFLPPKSLSQTIAALTGRNNIGPIELDRSQPRATAGHRLLRGLASVLSEELDLDCAPYSPLAAAEIEQAILVSYVRGSSHNYSSILIAPQADLAPHQVRQVEEYIEANWDQPLSIEGLAVVAHASARSIFQSFRTHRGRSPMKFVKTVRLRRAREMLQRPSPESTVTNIALSCGFGNLGHFARDYQQAFGEMPSSTLHRAKDISGFNLIR